MIGPRFQNMLIDEDDKSFISSATRQETELQLISVLLYVEKNHELIQGKYF